LLRKENESIRMKMLEGERYSELEIDNLKAKLHEMHEAELDEVKLNHQRYVDCLQVELKKMEGALRNKNEEIEQLIKEKTSVRQLFQSEGGRLK
jgi:predicted RNase H-like nuclease (RuvC/YqgF family)